MSKTPTILQQFRSFCFQNNATDLEKAIEYFSVFGGMGWRVDMSKPLEQIIEEKVLKTTDTSMLTSQQLPRVTP